MVLLEDCPPTGGCFTLWPTSHHRLFPLFTTSQGNFPKDITNFSTLGPGGHMSSPTVKQTLSDIAATVRPVEFDGRAGDVCFVHHRLAHNASPKPPARERPIDAGLRLPEGLEPLTAADFLMTTIREAVGMRPQDARSSSTWTRGSSERMSRLTQPTCG